jgi:hypothetical protein
MKKCLYKCILYVYSTFINRTFCSFSHIFPVGTIYAIMNIFSYYHCALCSYIIVVHDAALVFAVVHNV